MANSLVQDDIEQMDTYSNEELKMLHERAEKYLTGEAKTFPVEESFNLIRERRDKSIKSCDTIY